MSGALSLVLVVASNAALLIPGFLIGYLLGFRSRTWGAVALSIGLVLAVFGWLAAFSLAGLALLLAGAVSFGIGLEGMVFAHRGRHPLTS